MRKVIFPLIDVGKMRAFRRVLSCIYDELGGLPDGAGLAAARASPRSPVREPFASVLAAWEFQGFTLLEIGILLRHVYEIVIKPVGFAGCWPLLDV
jgi:hypothetical protein